MRAVAVVEKPPASSALPAERLVRHVANDENNLNPHQSKKLTDAQPPVRRFCAPALTLRAPHYSGVTMRASERCRSRARYRKQSVWKFGHVCFVHAVEASIGSWSAFVAEATPTGDGTLGGIISEMPINAVSQHANRIVASPSLMSPHPSEARIDLLLSSGVQFAITAGY